VSFPFKPEGSTQLEQVALERIQPAAEFLERLPGRKICHFLQECGKTAPCSLALGSRKRQEQGPGKQVLQGAFNIILGLRRASSALRFLIWGSTGIVRASLMCDDRLPHDGARRLYLSIVPSTETRLWRPCMAKRNRGRDRFIAASAAESSVTASLDQGYGIIRFRNRADHF